MTSHITKLARTSFAILRQLRSVSRFFTQDATRHLVQSLILSRIDYCNVTFTGLLQRCIIRLQAVINASFWNALPSRLRSELLALSLPLFRSRLKTILFDHGLVLLGWECL